MLDIYHIDHASAGIDTIQQLFREYASELNVDLCFQSFEVEVENPLQKYGPPKGSLLLAYWYSAPAGCIALQSLDNEVCEMKRLYVRPEYREHGIGDALVKQIIKDAEQLGYKKMVLDTLERLKAAIGLYQKHGFVNTSAYYKNPLAGVVYMEKSFD